MMSGGRWLSGNWLVEGKGFLVPTHSVFRTNLEYCRQT